MTTAHITQDGQIAIPKDILDDLHVRAGDTVAIETEPDGSIRIYPKTLTASDVAGMLKTNVRSTIEEMDEAVAEAFKKGHAVNALDTNVIVRLITDDDPVMRDKAVDLIETAHRNAEVLLLPIPALLETIWVLGVRYSFSRTEILDALERLLIVEGLRFEAHSRVRDLIRLGRSTNMDLADILIGLCSRDLGCEVTLTFDKKASKSALFREIH